MNPAEPEIERHTPTTDTFLDEVKAGLAQPQKAIPSKYFYDQRGSALFDQITELDAYYPTRTETAIMERHIGGMAEQIGKSALLVEYGSGSSTKTRILLDHLDLAAYVPIDISCEHLFRTSDGLAEAYPGLDILPVCADYTSAFALPDVRAARTVVYFPGSTIGNFQPDEAEAFLRRIADVCGTGGGLLIGVDLKKDRATLEAAYDDSEGITAEFNLNVLRRINLELGADFDLDAFAHRAVYNAEKGRIEMYLVSRRDQQVLLDGTSVAFQEGETIHTENSYKYSLADFARLAARAGFAVEQVWTDEAERFSVQYLEVKGKG